MARAQPAVDPGLPGPGSPGGTLRRTTVPLAAAIFAVLAIAGITVREWPQLHLRGNWATMFNGAGDFAPADIVSALVSGRSVAAAYAHSGQPYPLPYLLAFGPFGWMHDP